MYEQADRLFFFMPTAGQSGRHGDVFAGIGLVAFLWRVSRNLDIPKETVVDCDLLLAFFACDLVHVDVVIPFKAGNGLIALVE